MQWGWARENYRNGRIQLKIIIPNYYLAPINVKHITYIILLINKIILSTLLILLMLHSIFCQSLLFLFSCSCYISWGYNNTSIVNNPTLRVFTYLGKPWKFDFSFSTDEKRIRMVFSGFICLFVGMVVELGCDSARQLDIFWSLDKLENIYWLLKNVGFP